jgi:hypothetical protein
MTSSVNGLAASVKVMPTAPSHDAVPKAKYLGHRRAREHRTAAKIQHLPLFALHSSWQAQFATKTTTTIYNEPHSQSAVPAHYCRVGTLELLLQHRP